MIYCKKGSIIDTVVVGQEPSILPVWFVESLENGNISETVDNNGKKAYTVSSGGKTTVAYKGFYIVKFATYDNLYVYKKEKFLRDFIELGEAVLELDKQKQIK